MIRPCVDFQLAVHRGAERRFGQHAVHGFFDDARWLRLPDGLGPLLAEPALVSAVAPVNLLLQMRLFAVT